jgi:hypothetical protein
VCVPIHEVNLHSGEGNCVGFEVLTAMDITPCIPLKVNRRFGG